MEVVDPIFYVTHVLFFVWGAVLLGFFVKDLIAEVLLNGWRTPRCLWVVCLCMSSTVYVLLQLDPRGILGLYSPAALKLIEWCVVLSVLQSFAFTGYMYLIAIYQRNLSPVPPLLRNYWLAFNLALTLLHVILSLIGSLADNLFWFGVDSCVLVVHEFSQILVLNVCICGLARYLQRLTQQQGSIGMSTNFSHALRKMLFVRVGSIVIFVIVVLYQVLGPDGTLVRVSTPYMPILKYNSTTFSFSNIVGIFLIAVLHVLLLYMLRRPQAKSQRTSERTPAKEISTSSRASVMVKVDPV